MKRDAIEALTNALVGLAVSTVAVWLLRASGAWVSSPAAAISAVFFGLGLGRSWALRALFRRLWRSRSGT